MTLKVFLVGGLSDFLSTSVIFLSLSLFRSSSRSPQGGWDHITVRGNSIEAPRVRMPSLTPSLTSSLTDPLRPPPPRSLLPVMITEMENGNAVRC